MKEYDTPFHIPSLISRENIAIYVQTPRLKFYKMIFFYVFWVHPNQNYFIYYKLQKCGYSKHSYNEFSEVIFIYCNFKISRVINLFNIPNYVYNESKLFVHCSSLLACFTVHWNIFMSTLLEDMSIHCFNVRIDFCCYNSVVLTSINESSLCE